MVGPRQRALRMRFTVNFTFISGGKFNVQHRTVIDAA